MRAAIIREYGSNDVVEIAEVDRPQPGVGEVLVKVHAAGVNPIDWKIRGGMGQRMGMTLPIHLGSEFVGTIEKLGVGVDNFQQGDTIFGMVHTGAFADYAVAKAINVVRTPDNIDVIHAAALPLAGSTAWQALFDEAGLSAGQRLLITNSSGGVGSLGVQFAKACGAHVTAVASGRNEDFVRALGADEFIDYTTRPFEDAAREVDIVLDTMGGETFQRAFETLRKGGFMVTVVAFPNDEAERYGVSVKRSFTVPNARNLVSIAELVEAGKVVAHVDTVLPLAEIRQALTLSQAGRARGKIVLTPAD
ncbi:NADP-dependent oxidoreductase [Agrobacterium rosae]|uniref:NADP-dependent oxidoreductase n=1 Tax=Agrobacterium rosae TaxID=1972867 RepID=A0AAE5RSU4_9HYPH|nr:NADP-dependent oxidoreductase [Agrobacterium rosae]KAA3506541.1 NADP-dependent oxidoreductase [Agrobacterium rosae]KAA3516593.1 NADP-dependent oxidoreductase [Agrobacterium rosae]MCM2436286.1 NADP-dependent oxidoreductase [Agrobacterium rosae]MDX8332961.1 NADP-dependent oxidoreductase [Agrobacterium rosae]MQB50404.1 NADP-dependent oxidoreductase [Agrobacterium rosae]